MSDKTQINTGKIAPCLQQKIDKTRYLAEVHFSDTSTQSVEDKLKRVILHDLNIFTSSGSRNPLCRIDSLGGSRNRVTERVYRPKRKGQAARNFNPTPSSIRKIRAIALLCPLTQTHFAH